MAKIVAHVAAMAAAKIQAIHDAIPFLDLTRIAAKISKHPRMARHAASVASNPNLANFQRPQIEVLAASMASNLPNLRVAASNAASQTT